MSDLYICVVNLFIELKKREASILHNKRMTLRTTFPAVHPACLRHGAKKSGFTLE